MPSHPGWARRTCPVGEFSTSSPLVTAVAPRKHTGAGGLQRGPWRQSGGSRPDAVRTGAGGLWGARWAPSLSGSGDPCGNVTALSHGSVGACFRWKNVQYVIPAPKASPQCLRETSIPTDKLHFCETLEAGKASEPLAVLST